MIIKAIFHVKKNTNTKKYLIIIKIITYSLLVSLIEFKLSSTCCITEEDVMFRSPVDREEEAQRSTNDRSLMRRNTGVDLLSLVCSVVCSLNEAFLRRSAQVRQ